jgi:hypothetical protein
VGGNWRKDKHKLSELFLTTAWESTIISSKTAMKKTNNIKGEQKCRETGNHIHC